MEYIQCPHCHKKYGVNDKLRSASGKTIRCKQCSKSFEIIIFSTPGQSKSPSLAKENKAAAATPSPASSHNRGSRQFIFTSALAALLIAGLVGVYLLNQPQTSPVVEKTTAQVPLLDKKTKSKPKTVSSNQKKHEANKPGQRANVSNNRMKIDTSSLSYECKQAATDQWFTDYMMTHGTMTNREYLRLLDESSGYTEEVRTLCKNNKLAALITDAARQDIKPDYIKAEIEDRSGKTHKSGAQDFNAW